MKFNQIVLELILSSIKIGPTFESTVDEFKFGTCMSILNYMEAEKTITTSKPKRETKNRNRIQT